MNLPEQRILDAAQSLAARGQYRVALLLLDMLKDDASNVRDAMMLRGKILAQNGKYTEAIGAWEKILCKWPDHRGAQDCISRAKQMQKSPIGAHWPRVRLVAVAGVCFCVLLLLVAAFAVGRRMTVQDHTRRQALFHDLQVDVRKAVDTAVAEAIAAQPKEDRGKWMDEIAGLQSQIQETLATPPANSITGQTQVVGERILSLLGDTQTRLSSLRLDMAKEQTAVEGMRATREFQTSTTNEWARWSRQLGEISAQLGVVMTQQDQIAEGQIAQSQSVASLSQSMNEAHSELSAMKEQVVQERLRSDQAIKLTIESLRPGHMGRLEREIKDTEESVALLKSEEGRLRGKDNLLDAFRHKRTVNNLRDAKTRLDALREQWDMQIVPWLRTLRATVSAANHLSGSTCAELSGGGPLPAPSEK